IQAGCNANYFPSNVIEGMLAGIGIIIIIQHIPVDLGAENIKSIFNNGTDALHIGTLFITLISLALLLLWEKSAMLRKIKLLPGALVAVCIGIIINEIFIMNGSSWAISNNKDRKSVV